MNEFKAPERIDIPVSSEIKDGISFREAVISLVVIGVVVFIAFLHFGV